MLESLLRRSYSMDIHKNECAECDFNLKYVHRVKEKKLQRIKCKKPIAGNILCQAWKRIGMYAFKHSAEPGSLIYLRWCRCSTFGLSQRVPWECGFSESSLWQNEAHAAAKWQVCPASLMWCALVRTAI